MNKKLAIFTLIICLILGGVAAYGHHLRQQKSEPYWINLPLNQLIENDLQRTQVKDQYETLAKSDQVILQTVKTAKLAQVWSLTEAEAAEKLRSLIYVTVRNSDSEKTTILELGVAGIHREAAITKLANTTLWTTMREALTNQ